LPILEGQPASPDHVDGGGPTDYGGWAHEGCNLSAGASYGNKLRAAAYRAAVGLQASAGNGVGLLVDQGQAGPAYGTIRETTDGRLERWTAYGWSPASQRW
jgi:hypothetical protein